MDIERAIEHLLDLHARAEIRMEKAEVRMERWEARMERADARADKADARADKAEARADRADARMDRFDKQLKATANLVRAGMKIVIKNSKDIAFLTASHRRLEKKMDRLIDQLQGRSGNGRDPR